MDKVRLAYERSFSRLPGTPYDWIAVNLVAFSQGRIGKHGDINTCFRESGGQQV